MEKENFITYENFINEEFYIFRKSDELYPIYLIEKNGDGIYLVTVNHSLDNLRPEVVIEPMNSLKKVDPETLYMEVKSQIVEFIKKHQKK